MHSPKKVSCRPAITTRNSRKPRRAATALLRPCLTLPTKGAHAYSAKLLDFGQANTNASFDFLQELVGAKSLSDATEVWSTHTRKQVETFAVQAKELAELTQKIAAETAEPIRTGASKLFQPAAR